MEDNCPGIVYLQVYNTGVYYYEHRDIEDVTLLRHHKDAVDAPAGMSL